MSLACNVPVLHAGSVANLVDQGFSAHTVLAIDAERLSVPVEIVRLPMSLLERFDAETATDQMTQLLRFISPLSTRLMIN